MTQVLFFHNAAEKVGAACQLAQAAWEARRSLIIYTPRGQLAEAINRQLWTRPNTGFIPHCMADSDLASETPLLLDGNLEQPAQCERLLNLADDTPPDFQRFTLVVETVINEAMDRQKARQRARDYKSSGCEVEFVDLHQTSAAQSAALWL